MFQRLRRRAAGRGRAPPPDPSDVYNQGWGVLYPPAPIEPTYPRTTWLNGQVIDRFPKLSQFLSKWMPNIVPGNGVVGDPSVVDDGGDISVVAVVV